MSSYLEEAAAVLRKAAQYANLHDRQVEVAKEFAILAAIDKGLVPAEYADRIRAAYADQNGSIQ